MSSQRPPSIDPVAAARWDAHRAARGSAGLPPGDAPWLHEEVGRRMQDRLQWIRRSPQAWADWAPWHGGLQAHQAVAQRYPQAARWICGDPVSTHGAPAARQTAQRVVDRLRAPAWKRWLGAGGAPLQAGEPPEGAVQLLWSNMALHRSADPQALLARWHRALGVDGFVMFSALGPDSLRELRTLYAELGWAPPAHEFTDMHDWGDMLVQGGFAEPVMDMERIVLTWATPHALLAELRTLGGNLHRDRFAGLRGRRWQERLLSGLAERLAQPGGGGRLALTFEIVYGHAFKAAPKARMSAETAVPLGDMRTMLGRSR